jgi:cation-transporting ATPase 13A3/4/5
MVKNMDIEIGLLRRFDFTSKLQRMSVIVKNLNDENFRLHVKGSPEKIRELCKSSSIPNDFHMILDYYAKNGFRLLACATRNLKISFRNIHKIERDKIEKDLTFIGFLIMENQLKPITQSIIEKL